MITHTFLRILADGKSLLSLYGVLKHLPPLPSFQVAQVTWPELSALSHAGAWGDQEKPQHDMAFLGKMVGREMVLRLVMVWMHPHQACLSSLDEVVRKHTLLIDLGDNWAYVFVQLNENAQHIPLFDEGYLSAMSDGMPSKSMCRHLCQLKVCKLLQYCDQVVYPEGLNGGLEPVQTIY